MRNRQKQRELKKQSEERLDTRNMYGNRDLTPYNAVTKLRGESKLLLK